MAKVKAPVIAYRPGRASNEPPPVLRAKLFANGRSQAVRLPKDFRMQGTEVLIRREGERIILEPIPDVPRDAKGWPIGFWKRIHAEAADLDNTWTCPADPVPEPIPPWNDKE